MMHNLRHWTLTKAANQSIPPKTQNLLKNDKLKRKVMSERLFKLGDMKSASERALTVAFVRNPWDRWPRSLHASWRTMLIHDVIFRQIHVRLCRHHEGSQSQTTGARRVRAKYWCHRNVIRQLVSLNRFPRLRRVKVEHVLRYLLAKPNSNRKENFLTAHFWPQSKSCPFCTIDFDVVSYESAFCE